MKSVFEKWLSIMLIIAILCSVPDVVVSAETRTEYGYIPVEYTDNVGRIEYLNVMQENGNIYVDAEKLGKRLGYQVKINDEKVIIYNNDASKALPYGVVAFYFDDTKCDVLNMMAMQQLESPFPAQKIGETAWIPLDYALLLLNSSGTVVGETLLISMPQKTVIDVFYDISKNGYTYYFDFGNDFGYTDGDYYTLAGCQHLVNIFNGILTFDGASWEQIFATFWKDFSAYDSRYGEDMALLICTNSDKELEAMVKQAEQLEDIFAEDGAIGDLFAEVNKIAKDNDNQIGIIQQQCQEVLEKIKQGNSTTSVYNHTYQRLENALNKSTWLSDLGADVQKVQTSMGKITSAFGVFAKIAEVTGYVSEFQKQDGYAVSALRQFIEACSSESSTPQAVLEQLDKTAVVFEGDMAGYSIYRYMSENIWEFIGSKSVGELIGTRANIALLVWNLSSSFIPFISDGLDAADKFELAIYATCLQADAYSVYFETLNNIRKNSEMLTAENLSELSQYAYVYLKSCYITRDAAVASLQNKSDSTLEKIEPLLRLQNDINHEIADNLAVLKQANVDNEGYIYGMLEGNNKQYILEHDDSLLKELLIVEKTDAKEDEIEAVERNNDTDRYDIVLVLDVSGSMAGIPLEETKSASIDFVSSILSENANIGLVTYDDSASIEAAFSTNERMLTNKILGIEDSGGTNIESGLQQAYEMLRNSSAKKKIIVLMSDGEPNGGKIGEELIAYANSIKDEDIYIYTVGFFENMGDDKASAQYLMEEIATDGCHYEVADSDSLVFFFGDVADQINGQKYIYVRIACPVDVTVAYGNEELCSSEEELNTRTDFGTLTFEDTETDDKVKILRLKEGVDYDVQIKGTGHGFMDYTIGFMDENGEYSDMRKFTNIKITKRTVIDTLASKTDVTVLKVDEDGDGKYDLGYKAGENERGKRIDYTYIIYIIVAVFLIIVGFVLFIIVKKRMKKLSREVK